MIDDASLSSILTRANLAPSVHNTQPTRWKRDGAAGLLLLADPSRHLLVSDPTMRDMGVSCGTAAEGTMLALAEIGKGAVIEDLWESRTKEDGMRVAARVEVCGDANASPLAAEVAKRFTCRGGFSRVPGEMARSLANWALARDDMTMVSQPSDIAHLADMADRASIGFMRDRAFRYELLRWMRLSRRDKRFGHDGLDLDGLQMGALEGAAARLILGTPLFNAIVAVGLAGTLAGEASKTRSSAAIFLFHREKGESPVTAGRAFYRAWLDLTRLGFVAWPMAALADNPETAEECSRRHRLPADRELVNVLRVGVSSASAPPRARLPASELLLA